jgi:NAD(P)H-dependent FMN reductase
MSTNGHPYVVAIGGSVRPNNYTNMALALVVDELRKQQKFGVEALHAAELQLALPGLAPTADSKRLHDLVTGAAAIILATPEYHGSYSSVIKLIIENLGFPSPLAAKPVSLLGVAAGQIGAIKALEHLRSVCSHVGALVLPGVVSVAGVQSLFDADGRCLDAATETRVRHLGTALLDYLSNSVCPRFVLEEMAREGNTDWMKHLTAR